METTTGGSDKPLHTASNAAPAQAPACHLCSVRDYGEKVWCDCGEWHEVVHTGCLEAWKDYLNGRKTLAQARACAGEDKWKTIAVRMAAGEI